MFHVSKQGILFLFWKPDLAVAVYMLWLEMFQILTAFYSIEILINFWESENKTINFGLNQLNNEIHFEFFYVLASSAICPATGRPVTKTNVIRAGISSSVFWQSTNRT